MSRPALVSLAIVTDYRSLKVWQKAHQLALAVYRVTQAFPREERFELSIQLRRSAASVPANLAEGCGRASKGELRQFVGISLGSANELDYQLLLAFDLGYLDSDAYGELVEPLNHVRRMLGSLLNRLR